jgi:hypothetical protein
VALHHYHFDMRALARNQEIETATTFKTTICMHSGLNKVLKVLNKIQYKYFFKVQTSTNKYKQVQTSTNKYKQVQTSTNEHKLVQTSTNKYKHGQTSTNKS